MEKRAIPSEYISELKAKTDIVEVIGNDTPLTRRGGKLFGLCPFHSEKTPSFSVSPEKQMFHCFGCGKSGDVIDFIMEREHLPYVDAVRMLAERAKLPIPDVNTNDPTYRKRETMLQINRDAARFFCEQLKRPEGKEAAEYLSRRGISSETAERFRVGAAPDSWTALIEWMGKKGYTEQQLDDAGLARRTENTGRHGYDVFRNRLMFPIANVRGDIIGFSGRALREGGPKYLNTGGTAVFQKGRNLFALDFAKQAKADRLILVEGVMDVVALHQAGFREAVASLGTALTPEQAGLISRYAKNVILAYDSDEAGQQAVKRAVPILRNAGISVKVLEITDTKDPDDYFRANGAEAFADLLLQSKPYEEYALDRMKRKYDLTSIEGRLGYFSEATGIICSLGNAVAREIYAAYAAKVIGVSEDTAKVEIERVCQEKNAVSKK